MKRLILAPILGTLVLAGCSSSRNSSPTGGPRDAAPQARLVTPAPVAPANPAQVTPSIDETGVVSPQDFSIPIPEASAEACSRFATEQTQLWQRQRANDTPHWANLIATHRRVLRSAYDLLSSTQKEELRGVIADLRITGSRALNPNLPPLSPLSNPLGFSNEALTNRGPRLPSPIAAYRRSIFDRALSLLEPMRPRMDHRLTCSNRRGPAILSFTIEPATHLENTLSTLRTLVDRSDATFPVTGPEFFDIAMRLGDGTCTESAGLQGILPQSDREALPSVSNEFTGVRPIGYDETSLGSCPRDTRRCRIIETESDTGVVDRQGLFVTWSDANRSKLLLQACDLRAQSRIMGPNIEVAHPSICVNLNLETGAIENSDLQHSLVTGPVYLDRSPELTPEAAFAISVNDARQAYARGDSDWLSQSEFAPYASCPAPATPPAPTPAH